MYKKLLSLYVTVVGLLAMATGGYIACGSQTYRIPVDNDTLARRPVSKPSNNGSENSGATVGLLPGVHSSRGWGNALPIPYKVSVEFTPEQVKQIEKAMQTWEYAVGKKLFEFVGVDSRRGSDFKNLYASLDDKVNGHYLDAEWEKVTGKPALVLATTIWENAVHDHNLIVKADIRYNVQHYVFGDSLKEYSQGNRIIVDLESLALHELGHLLGLSHISQEEDRFSVMNPSLFIGEGMVTRRLSEGDIERIRSIYGVGDASLANQLEKANDFSLSAKK